MKYPLLFPLLTFAFGILAILPARAATSDLDTLVATAERGIERGMLQGSTADIESAVKPVDAALATDPKNPALLYTRAFAHYAMTSSLYTEKDKAPVERELSKAASLLEHVQGQPWEAEAAGLGSLICGQLIGIRGGAAGMQLGPKAAMLLERAERGQPRSPRVLYYRGTSLLNTPPAFGGDTAAGVARLQQAVDGFAQADPAAPGPHWGQATALTWLGIAKKTKGDLPAARAAWAAALKLEPDYAWVQFVLLPSLDSPAKK